MKLAPWFMALGLVALTGCSTSPFARRQKPVGHWLSDPPETVMIIYHVQPLREGNFPKVLAHAWQVYRWANLVMAEPHIIVRDHDPEGKPRYTEIFTWKSHAAPDHPPALVQKAWNEEMTACEGRDGRPPIEGGEVEKLTR